MTQEYDALVVGSGNNSLSAAAYLARAGLKICVFEKNDIVGGGAVSREITAPGFKHDTHATAILQAMPNPMIKDDELELQSRFGLRFVSPEITFACVFEDETWLAGYISLDQTCESIAKFSARDAETYREFARRTIRMAPLFTQGMFKPPIPGDRLTAMLAQSEEGRELLDLSRRSVYDYVHDIFEHSKVRMHYMKWVSENMNHPQTAGSARDLYVLTSVAHTQEEAAVVGGTQEFSNALARCIEHHGGEIRTSTWVKRVVMRGGEAKGVELADGEIVRAGKCVVACIHPHILGDYVDGLDEDMLREARELPLSSYGAFNSHWALHEAPNYICPEANKAMLVETIPTDMERMMSSFDDSAAGKLAAQTNAIAAHQTNHDPTRAPEGKHTLYLYCHVPMALKHAGPLGHGEVDGWTDEIRDEYKEYVMQEYRKYTTNMGPENIIASAAHSPRDMAEWSPSFRNGDIFGISNLSPLGERPTPRLAQYAVPGADGLYLAGPFCHPGGGITGGGRATAMKVLMDLGYDLSTAFQI